MNSTSYNMTGRLDLNPGRCCMECECHVIMTGWTSGRCGSSQMKNDYRVSRIEVGMYGQLARNCPYFKKIGKIDEGAK